MKIWSGESRLKFVGDLFDRPRVGLTVFLKVL